MTQQQALWATLVTAIGLWFLTAPVAQAEPLARGEVDDLIQRGDAASFETLRDDYRSHGAEAARSLEGAIRIGGGDGLELAEEVIAATRATPDARLDAAVSNAMNHHTSDRALAILAAAVAERDPTAHPHARESYAAAWAGMWKRMHEGPTVFAEAAHRAADTNRSGIDRALHLRVLRLVGRGDRPERAPALAEYRKYLHDVDPELRRAAVRVNSALWDHTALRDLEQLAFGTDPQVRDAAWHLVVRYLTYGAERPGPGESTLRTARFLSMPVYDPRRLETWRARKPEWNAEQYRLVTGEELPPELPPPPAMRIERAVRQPPSGTSPTPLRP